MLELEAQSHRPHPARTACHEDTQRCQALRVLSPGAGGVERSREDRAGEKRSGSGVGYWSLALASHLFLSSQPWLLAWLRAAGPLASQSV